MPISSTKSINSITTGEQTFHHHHLVMVLMSSWLPRSQWLPQIHSPWMKSFVSYCWNLHLMPLLGNVGIASPSLFSVLVDFVSLLSQSLTKSNFREARLASKWWIWLFLVWEQQFQQALDENHAFPNIVIFSGFILLIVFLFKQVFLFWIECLFWGILYSVDISPGQGLRLLVQLYDCLLKRFFGLGQLFFNLTKQKLKKVCNICTCIRWISIVLWKFLQLYDGLMHCCG